MEDITSSIQKKGTKNYFSILIVCVVAIVTTSVALSILHIMFIKYCKNRPQRAQTLSIEPATSISLDKRILNTIPILFYSSKTCDLYRINQGGQCVICLGPLNKGDLVRWLPNCGHVFHVPCVDHWFHAHITCPVCRSLVCGARPSQGSCSASDSSTHGGCDRLLTRTRSGGLLCHSTKLVLPIQGLWPRDLVKVGLKRSLSMDECCVEIDTREQSSSSLFPCSSSANNDCCNNPPLSKIDFLLSRLYQAQSNNRRFNYMSSSMEFRSLHVLREGYGGTLRTNGILPY